MRFLVFFLFISMFSNCEKSVDNSQSDQENKSSIEVVKVCDLPAEAIESSGIIFFQNKLWTINDSGNDPELIVVDTSTGDLERIIEIKGAENVDWEALYQDEKYLYIADNGNNADSRSDYQIYLIAKDSLTNQEKEEVYPSKVITYYLDESDLSKIGHTRKSIDSEAIIVDKDSIYIYIKDWLEYKTYVFVINSNNDSSRAILKGKYDLGFASTAATRIDENTFAILGYKDYRTYLSLFTMPLNLIADSAVVKSYELYPLQGQQTEGLTYSNGSLFISCENMSVFNQALFRMRVPEH